jgi:hypothetical protein
MNLRGIKGEMHEKGENAKFAVHEINRSATHDAMLNKHRRLNIVHLIALSYVYGVYKRLQQEKEEIQQIIDIHMMQRDATDGEANAS